jgi:hypothetical protein
MSSQTKLIKDIMSLYDTILENKKVSEAVDVYDNVDFKDNEVGNSTPSRDTINTALLQDVQTAAKSAGLKVDITTAVSGHGTKTKSGSNSRHPSGNAVDIAKINGVGSGGATNSTNGNAKFREFGNKLKDALVSMGYVWNSESGNPKSVLWQTNTGGNHYNHVHISNNTKSTSQPTRDGKSNKDNDDTSNKDNDDTSTSSSSDSSSSDSSSSDSSSSTSSSLTKSIDGLKVDPFVMSISDKLTNFLGLKEEKIYSKFGDNTQTRRGDVVIPKDNNSKIKSPVSGTVIFRKHSRDCKNRVFIRHNINQETYYLEYCGISNLSVRDNREISKGDIIGTTDSDVRVSLYDSSNSKKYIDNFVGKELEPNPKKDKRTSSNKRTSSDNETVISKLLQLPFKPFQNKYDESGKMIEKRWGSPTEKEQPVDWINKLSPTYSKKLEENLNKIKNLLK